MHELEKKNYLVNHCLKDSEKGGTSIDSKIKTQISQKIIGQQRVKNIRIMELNYCQKSSWFGG